jgi:hypothetical protein
MKWLRTIDVEISDYVEVSGCLIQLGYDSPASLGDASWQEVSDIYAYHSDAQGAQPLTSGRALLRLIHDRAVSDFTSLMGKKPRDSDAQMTSHSSNLAKAIASLAKSQSQTK